MRLTAERLRELLHYEPTTGVFTWRVSRVGAPRAGTVAGCMDGQNHHSSGFKYWRICIDYRRYRRGRLAWLYVHGCWPSGGSIDHIDGNEGNDAIANLRDATPSQNQYNRHAQKNTPSGLKGVQRVSGSMTNPWRARIVFNKAEKHLGCFSTAREAAAAYDSAARLYFGEFAKTNEMLGLL